MGSYRPASFCDGQGGCALARSEGGCPSGLYCAAGSCTPLLDGGADCTGTTTSSPEEACASGACLGGHCCAAPCGANDVDCRARACDSSGACVYPDSSESCGQPVCNGDVLAPAPTCDGHGNCVACTATPCEPYACNATLSSCDAVCTLDGGECAVDAYCADGACAPKLSRRGACAPTSTSGADDSCQSGTCCPNYFGCAGPEGCDTSCALNSDCVIDAGAFCDNSALPSVCCAFRSGDTLYVDGANGNDNQSCCGGQAHPCQTLTHAMDLIWNGSGNGLIVHAFNSDGTKPWVPREAGIHLGLGVTLDAPGILFSFGNPAFLVYGYGAADTAPVAVRGTAAEPIEFGCLPSGACLFTAIDDGMSMQPALPLVVSGASIAARPSNSVAGSIGMTVGLGASVTFGPDPVEITLQNPTATGINCSGGSLQDDPLATAPVLSFHGYGDPLLDLGTRELGTTYIAASDCSVSLTRGPVFGNQNQPYPVGCGYRPLTAIAAYGNSLVTLGSADLPGTIQCAVIGIDQERSGSDMPTVNLDHMTIDLAATGDLDSGWAQGGSCAGALVMAGSFTASSSTFVHSSMGVYVGGVAAAVDLSGGDGGGNTFGCNEELPQGCSRTGGPVPLPPSGADLVNATAAVQVDAQNTTWDHWSAVDGMTQVWSCTDATYTSCTCSGVSCPGGGGAQSLPPGADAVFLSTNTTALPIDSSQGTEATATSCP